MTDASFSDILNKPSDSIKPPVPMPVGTYLAMVKGQPLLGKSKQKGTPFAEFTMQLLQASEAILESGALPEFLNGRKLTDVTMKNTYYLTDEAAYRLKDFCDHCGVDNSNGVSLGQRVAATPGCKVLIEVKHKPSEDGTKMFANITATSAVGA